MKKDIYDARRSSSSPLSQKLRCSFCGFKAADLEKLGTHLLTHSSLSEQLWSCAFCPASARTSEELIEHQNKHMSRGDANASMDLSTSRSYSLACFSAYNKLKQDNNVIHHFPLSPRSHKCSFCPFSSDVKTNVAAHERTHTGEKPFKCAFCSYASTQKAAVQGHEKRRHPQLFESMSQMHHFKTDHPGRPL